MLCLGLMSGTSADMAVLARFMVPIVLHGSFRRRPYSPLRESCSLARANHDRPALLDLAEAVTEQQALAARGADPDQRAALIGCHGQTVWHRPPSGSRRGASWQLLQAPLLAQLLARPVVHDFRAADLALGGQGAPLVPRADAALIGAGDGWRGVLNLGGIANLTLIPPRCGPQRREPVLGWDCGPANSLIDLAVEGFSDGQQLFDRDGAMAAAGRCDEAVIQRWLAEPYFQLSPPKSTGRECFGREDLKHRLRELGAIPAADAVATLTGFTAAVVAQDLTQLQTRSSIQPMELLVAGGGSRNPVLMRELQHRCRGIAVRESDQIGLAAEAREALVFALLAWWHHRGHPGNAPAITGATREACLGVRVRPV